MADPHAPQLRMRPVYDWLSGGAPDEFIPRLSQLVSFDPAVDIQYSARHAVLQIPKEARHTWSPTLDVTVRDHAGKTHVHARLGPEPEVWTLLVFLAAATAVPSFFAGLLGVVQLAMGEPATGLGAVLLGGLALGAVYGTSVVGKHLGADQIHRLLAVLEANLDTDARFVEGGVQGAPSGGGGTE